MTDRGIRVLAVTSVFPRHPEDNTPPFVRNLCRDLVTAGCTITVLVPHSPGIPVCEEADGLRVVRFRYMWPPCFQTLCYEGGMVVRLRENRWRTLQLPFFALSQGLAIRRLLRTGDFDLLHAHSLLPQGFLAARARANSRIPLVISSHGADVYQLKPRWEELLRKAVSRSNALVANSRATAERLQELGADPEKIHRIPATPNFEDPVQPIHQWPDHPILLYAGRCIPEKGVDVLLEAMPDILARFPECRLRIAGAGNLDVSLRKRAVELGISRHVDFLGWLTPGDLHHAMAGATLLVAPSRVIEGQNLVVTEALSVGCPVAVTPKGGMLDLVKDGRTGFIIENSEPQCIARSVHKILSFPLDALEQVRRKGFLHFKETYSRNSITGKTMALYQTLINRDSATVASGKRPC